MTLITMEELQSNFEDYLSRVENGEGFIVGSNHGSVMMIPYKEVVEIFESQPALKPST